MNIFDALDRIASDAKQVDAALERDVRELHGQIDALEKELGLSVSKGPPSARIAAVTTRIRSSKRR